MDVCHMAVYKIKFVLAAELNFETVNLEPEYELTHALTNLSKLLMNDCQTLFKEKDGETDEKKHNHCWSHPGTDVHVLRLNDCYTVFDCRNDHCQVAIQKSAAWQNNPDMVRDLLQNTLSKAMSYRHGVQVIFDHKMQPARIWEYCEHRVKVLNDPIRTITLEVDNPNLIKDYTEPDDMGMIIKNMTECVKSLGAMRAMFKLFAGNDNPMLIEQKVDDLVQMVKVCSNRAYKLTVGFERMKAYRCDEKVKAMFPLHADDIEAFQRGNKVLDYTREDGQEYALVQWLNYIDLETKNYETESQIHRPRTNRHR